MPYPNDAPDHRTVGVSVPVRIEGDPAWELFKLKSDPAKHVGTVDGMCRMLSKGDACTCLKCVIDKASERDVLRKAISDYLDASSGWNVPGRYTSDAPINKLAAAVGR